MERLTFRTDLGVSADKNEDCPTCSICWGCDMKVKDCKYFNDVLEKLAKYEDAEEQRRLFQFPCKVGDTVYALFFTHDTPKYCECEVEQIIIHAGVVEMNVLIKMEHIRSRLEITLFGKTVFLTEDEAKKALAELSNKTEF